MSKFFRLILYNLLIDAALVQTLENCCEEVLISSSGPAAEYQADRLGKNFTKDSCFLEYDKGEIFK